MSDIISTNREIDAACAKALGKAWTRPTHGTCCTCQDCGWDYDNCQCGYSENPEKSELLENEIERRGLQSRYVHELIQIVRPAVDPSDELRFIWRLIRATPEQKARAFLKAVGGGDG